MIRVRAPLCALIIGGLPASMSLTGASSAADNPSHAADGVSISAAGGHQACTLKSIRGLLSKIPGDSSVKEVGIDSVKPVSGLGAHCEVIGHTITQNPGPNKVGWSVLLPDERFAGRYLVQG